MYGSQLNGRGDRIHLDPLRDQTYASSEAYDDPDAAYQRNLLEVVRRRLWVVALVMVVVTALAGGFTLLQTPLYTTSIKILVDARGNNESVGEPADIVGLQDLTGTLTELVTIRPVAQDVVRRLGLSVDADSLLDDLSAEQIQETQLIEVSYTNPDPQEAQRVANAVGAVFSERVAAGDLGGGGGTADVVQKAALPTSPASPNPLRNLALALVAGLMLGVAFACLLDYLDDNWRSPDEVERVTGAPTLGVIPTLKVHKNDRKGLLD